MRQPSQSTRGPPTMRPSAGAPAVVMDHQPIARTRPPSGLTEKSRAIAVGCVAPPSTADTVRSPISEKASHANAVRAATTVEPAKPQRKTRRCP
jgi:hypothetical protein